MSSIIISDLVIVPSFHQPNHSVKVDWSVIREEEAQKNFHHLVQSHESHPLSSSGTLRRNRIALLNHPLELMHDLGGNAIP